MARREQVSQLPMRSSPGYVEDVDPVFRKGDRCASCIVLGVLRLEDRRCDHIRVNPLLCLGLNSLAQ